MSAKRDGGLKPSWGMLREHRVHRVLVIAAIPPICATSLQISPILGRTDAPLTPQNPSSTRTTTVSA